VSDIRDDGWGVDRTELNEWSFARGGGHFDPGGFLAICQIRSSAVVERPLLTEKLKWRARRYSRSSIPVIAAGEKWTVATPLHSVHPHDRRREPVKRPISIHRRRMTARARLFLSLNLCFRSYVRSTAALRSATRSRHSSCSTSPAERPLASPGHEHACGEIE
jgi:hypothetical protein